MQNKAFVTVPSLEKGISPNPGMYGIFFEEINHAGDGGLYAELVRNRAFADAKIPEGSYYYNGEARNTADPQRPALRPRYYAKVNPSDTLPGWDIETGRSGLGSIEPWLDDPRNPDVPHQLKLTARNTKSVKVSLCNKGFWGMNIKKGEYRLTVIARSDEISELTAELAYEKESGPRWASNAAENIIIAKTVVTGIGPGWKKFSVIFHASENASQCKLLLTPLNDGAIYFDFVSLFPVATFMGRENGMNIAVAEMLKAMKPGFMRFPGGCIVEGISLENAFLFKKTIGPIEDRPGTWNLWGYRRTDGLGFHEYLQFCEDIGADGMFVCNCGMSCQARNEELGTDEQVEYFLQDAVDAIDYAISPASAKWGKLRAEAGHPEPFPLKYVEIGNENRGEAYFERYKKFYDVLSKKFPDLVYISNDCSLVRATKPPMLDEHFYVSPEGFTVKYHRYDNYDRSGSMIYVGEYATNQKVGIGNLAAAASEAVFMIGMENNGDIVKIASYAPLLCHVDDRTWPVNLVCYKDDVVFGIPSYYVQKLFSNELPEYMVPCEAKITSFTGEAFIFANAGINAGGELVVKIVNFSENASITELRAPEGYKQTSILAIEGENGFAYNDFEHPQTVSAKELPIDRGCLEMKPYGVYIVKLTK